MDMHKSGLGAAILGAVLGGSNPFAKDEQAETLGRNPDFAKNCMTLGHTLGDLKNCVTSLEKLVESVAFASTDAPELLGVTACQFDNIAKETEKMCKEVTNLLAERLAIDPRCAPKKPPFPSAGEAPSTLGRGRRAASPEEATGAMAYTPGDGKGF